MHFKIEHVPCSVQLADALYMLAFSCSSVSVPTTFEAINCKPDGDTLDPRKVTFDVNGNSVKVTVWRKKDPSKPKVVGTLVVPSGTVHLDGLLVPTTEVLTEMVYKLKLKDASVFDKDGKEKKEASFTIQLNLLAEHYDAMAKALCESPPAQLRYPYHICCCGGASSAHALHQPLSRVSSVACASLLNSRRPRDRRKVRRPRLRGQRAAHHVPAADG